VSNVVHLHRFDVRVVVVCATVLFFMRYHMWTMCIDTERQQQSAKYKKQHPENGVKNSFLRRVSPPHQRLDPDFLFPTRASGNLRKSWERVQGLFKEKEVIALLRTVALPTATS
jgi:hypothetical protein